MADNLVIIFLRTPRDDVGVVVSRMVRELRDAGNDFVPSVTWRNVDVLTEAQRVRLAQLGARVGHLFPDVYPDPASAPAPVAPVGQTWDG